VQCSDVSESSSRFLLGLIGLRAVMAFLTFLGCFSGSEHTLISESFLAFAVMNSQHHAKAIKANKSSLSGVHTRFCFKIGNCVSSPACESLVDFEIVFRASLSWAREIHPEICSVSND
jgi:hypothetical protein